MSCERTPGCPLFPYLNASLAGWRAAYCDNESGWRDCERFRRASAGREVPLALLPNGKIAGTLLRVPELGPDHRSVEVESSSPVEVVPTSSGREPTLPGRGRLPRPPAVLAYPHPGAWWRTAIRWLRSRI